MEPLHGLNIGALVKACFFDCGADEQATVAARDEVDVWCADDVPNEIARLHRHAQHLSFDRSHQKSLWTDLACPCSRAVYDYFGKKRCLRSCDASHMVVREINCCYGICGGKV